MDSRGLTLMNKKGEPFTFDYKVTTPRTIKKTYPTLPVPTAYKDNF